MSRLAPRLAPWRTGLLVSGVIGLAIARAAAGQPNRDMEVLARALALIEPRPDVPVILIDPELSADPASLRALDAFIARESNGRLRPTVYLNSRAPLVRSALTGTPLGLAVLASLVHHEIQHLRGSDEPAAQAAERALFQRLMERGVIDTRDGAQYLAEVADARRRQARAEPDIHR